MTGFTEHSRLVEGEWPLGNGAAGPGGAELEAVIGERTAKDMGYGVGSRLYITPFPAAPEERIILDVVGLARPHRPAGRILAGSAQPVQRAHGR